MRKQFIFRYSIGGKQKEKTLQTSGNLPKNKETIYKWQMWLVESKDPKIEADKEISQIVLLAISTFNFLLEQYFAVKKTFIRTKTQQKA